MAGFFDGNTHPTSDDYTLTPEQQYKEGQREGSWREFEEYYRLEYGPGQVFTFDNSGDPIPRKTSPGVSRRALFARPKEDTKARLEAQRQQAKARGLPSQIRRYPTNMNSRMAFVQNADDLPAVPPVEASSGASQESSSASTKSSSWTGAAAILHLSSTGTSWADEDDDDDMLYNKASTTIADALAAATLPDADNMTQQAQSADSQSDLEDTTSEASQPEPLDHEAKEESQASTMTSDANESQITIQEDEPTLEAPTESFTLSVEDLKAMLFILDKSPSSFQDYVAALNKSIKDTIHNAKAQAWNARTNRINQLESLNGELYNQNESLQQELDSQKALFKANQASAIGLEDELQSENEDLQDRILRRDHTIRKLQEQKEKASKSNDFHQQEWLRVSAENAKLTLELKKAAKYKEERNMMYAQTKVLKIQVERVNGELQEAMKEKEEIREKTISEMETQQNTQVANLQEQVESLHGTLQATTERYEKLVATNTSRQAGDQNRLSPFHTDKATDSHGELQDPHANARTLADLRLKVGSLQVVLLETKAAEAEEAARTARVREEVRQLRVRKRTRIREEVAVATELVDKLRAKLEHRRKARRRNSRDGGRN